MDDVSFNEEQDITRYAPAAPAAKGGIIGLIMRTGLAKTEAQANMVMISIIVIAFIVMGFIWLAPSKNAPKPQQSPLPPAMPATH